MRRIFLIVMIALLPLRGWMGDAMAMTMAADMVSTANAPVTVQKSDATYLIANYLYSPGAVGQFDGLNASVGHVECPGHAHQTAALSDAIASSVDADADGANNGHCSTCGLCQICHTVALATSLGSDSPARIMPPAPVPQGSASFTSALPALSQKPPIS